ncbi:MAG: hypothetical protein ACRELV_09905 [Longimicrobiales bacterium]
MNRIRTLMLVEAATFVAASLIHAGFLIGGYEHGAASVAEGIIAAVLLLGVIVAWARPAWTRTAGLLAQAFALLGTLVGLFTIAVGIGPRTLPDIVYHLAIVVVLIWGLVIARLIPVDPRRGRTIHEA